MFCGAAPSPPEPGTALRAPYSFKNAEKCYAYTDLAQRSYVRPYYQVQGAGPQPQPTDPQSDPRPSTPEGLRTGLGARPRPRKLTFEFFPSAASFQPPETNEESQTRPSKRSRATRRAANRPKNPQAPTGRANCHEEPHKFALRSTAKIQVPSRRPESHLTPANVRAPLSSELPLNPGQDCA